MITCPYVCNNKTEFGYCCSTACINPKYNQQSITQWLEKADYVQVVRCKDCKYKQGSACDYSAVWVRPNGFCHWGERKDDV